MVSNYVSELISFSKSAKKTAKTKDPLRALSTVGYAAKFIDKTAKLSDTTAGQFATELIDTFAKATDGTGLGVCAKGALNIAKHTDEIGMLRSGIKTFKSDSPARTFLRETCGWIGRFVCKDLILEHGAKLLNIKGVKPVADAVTKFSKNTKGFGQVPNIIGGVTYSFAKEFGKKGGKAVGNFIADKLGLPPDKNKVKENTEELSPRQIAHAPLR